MLSALIQTDGLVWLILAAALAGIVRGFAGFGTAMVFVPVAARVTDPVSAVLMLVTMDLLGPLPTVPRALRDGHPPDLLRLGLGLLLGLPLGVAFLTWVPVEGFRLAVSGLSLVLLVLLASGLRYSGRLSPPLVVGAGALSGLLGGATTLFGPPVILFYMASTLTPRAVRANLMLYLIVADVAFIAVLGVAGALSLAPMLLGLALVVPYGLATLAGSALFRPESGRLYRVVAYGLIAGAAVAGLPIFG